MEPFFLPSLNGSIYALHLPTEAPAKAVLLWLPPFAEEANCARRHIVAAARECQALGYASLLIDPYGTGESDGELRHASWDIWRRNVLDAIDWLQARHSSPVWLAGVRAGALLAADVAAQVQLAGMLWWQPVTLGRAVLDAFLRMKLVSEWAQTESDTAGIILGRMRAQLAEGKAVDVGGYLLPASLATSLQTISLTWPRSGCPALACMEFRSHGEGAVLQHTPAAQRLCESMREAGAVVASTVCQTPQFWSAHEAPLTPGLGQRVAALLEALHHD